MKTGPRVVVLLGMHRSGTSVIMHLLHRLGVPIDDELVPAAPDNPRGFWESRRIVAIHDRLFAQFGLSWKDPLSTAPLPPSWWRHSSLAATRRELIRILREGLAENHGLWGFKDPRTVRFLPLWKEVLAEVGAEPSWILAFRHPGAVVDSLAARSRLDRDRCELLWIEHNLDALTNIDPKDLVALSFERLLADPAPQLRRVLRRLDFLAVPSDGQLTGIVETVLDAAMVHRRGADSGCSTTALTIHSWLEGLAGDAPPATPTPAELVAGAARDVARLIDGSAKPAPSNRLRAPAG